MEHLKSYPQYAFINPNTGIAPETKSCDAKDFNVLNNWLHNNIQKNQRYAMAYFKKESGHIVVVTKTEYDELYFYDPQTGETLDEISMLLKFQNESGIIEGKEHTFKIFRIDNAELNFECLNGISEKY